MAVVRFISIDALRAASVSAPGVGTALPIVRFALAGVVAAIPVTPLFARDPA